MYKRAIRLLFCEPSEANMWHILSEFTRLGNGSALSSAEAYLDREDWGEGNIKRAEAGEREKASARRTLGRERSEVHLPIVPRSFAFAEES